MPTATLTFQLPDEDAEWKQAAHAQAAYAALWEIAQEVFRPARKHGYMDQRIQAALEAGDGPMLVGLLEEKFYDILREHDVVLD